ncbi:hypothetical protein [Fimbriimonas ginsengisoli]|uniref:Uncharacterized protein n=1 Tax=Fimbriimonas ginsengisoli Gsoil 348 TaxID=661478 RepID=A0A068NVL2_FIMGI|nr:hypothetical protein [Fimbriimonas ginsengisoli]AIE85614.1 hypothetical protein OP10G_2246 [Fimbriimonas ginsengisoli Gsoil 348]
MKSKFWIAGVLALTCFGCNIGNAPEPMSETDLKSALEKLPAKEQIDYINASPMPAKMKAQRIKEIEDKTGYKAPKTGAPQTPH